MHRNTDGFKETVEFVDHLVCHIRIGEILIKPEKRRAEHNKTFDGIFGFDLLHPAGSDDRKSRAVRDVKVCRKRVLDGMHRPTGISDAV